MALKAGSGYVKYGTSSSHQFLLQTGVRQGSLLGGPLWAVYIDDLFQQLRQSDCGLVFNGVYQGVQAYADDIVLSSSTNSSLKVMLDITQKFAATHQIRLNPKKTVALHSGRVRSQPIRTFSVEGSVIPPVSRFRYLGYELITFGHRNRVKVCVSIRPILHNFFAATNSILLLKCYDVLLRARLLRTYALPYLDNGFQVLNFLQRKERFALYSAFSKALRRCLKLHSRASTDLVCAAVAWLPPDIRAAQLVVYPDFRCMCQDRCDVSDRWREGNHRCKICIQQFMLRGSDKNYRPFRHAARQRQHRENMCFLHVYA